MAYRAPRYSYVHAARDVGASAITVSHTAHADFPKDNLIDDRAGTLFKWSASVGNPTIDINLGSGFVTGLSRLIIPANHNIESITVQDDDNASFTSPATLHAADTSINAGTLYDSGAFDTGNSTQQYIRIKINGTAQFYLPQIVLTKILELDIGPVLAEAVDEKQANITRLRQNTGLSPTVQHGPQQRILEYVYEYPLSDAGSSTDLTDMEAFVDAVGMTNPFWVDPASFSATPATDDPVLWMKFAEMPRVRLSNRVPMVEDRAKTYELRLIESLD
jgi:hypothetical protein